MDFGTFWSYVYVICNLGSFSVCLGGRAYIHDHPSFFFLVGALHINKDRLLHTTWVDLLSRHKKVLPGGHWIPRDCTPRRKVAVIIPYRDRQRHLRAFLAHTMPIFQRQLIEYRIFVIEQVESIDITVWPVFFQAESGMF